MKIMKEQTGNSESTSRFLNPLTFSYELRFAKFCLLTHLERNKQCWIKSSTLKAKCNQLLEAEKEKIGNRDENWQVYF